MSYIAALSRDTVVNRDRKCLEDLINSLLYAKELVGGRAFAGVIGGTHLVDADPVRLQRTTDTIGQFDIGRIAPCHCTGFRGQVALWEAFGERFVTNMAGNRMVFG